MRLLKTFSLIVLTFFLLGCLFQDESPKDTSDKVIRPHNNPTTIDFWHTFNPEEVGTLDSVLKSFEKENPQIKVNAQFVPFSDALNKYKTVAQAGKAPDIFRAEIGWTTELASLGHLLAIDAFMPPERQSLFLPQALAYNKYKGHIWGVPQVTDCLVMFYNKRLLPEGPPKDIEELIQVGQRLTDPEKGKYAFFFRGDPYWYLPFVWSFGGDMLDPKTLEIQIDQKPAVDALQFLIDLRNKYKIVTPTMDFANDNDNQKAQFGQGNYAMMISGPWDTAALLETQEFQEHPENLGIARIPAGPAGFGSPIGGHNYVISANSQKIWASWKVIEFLSRPESQAQFALKNKLLPTQMETYDLPEVKANRMIQDFKYVLEAANNRPVIPQGGALLVDLKPAFQAALFGEKTPEVAMKEVKEAWTKLLKE